MPIEFACPCGKTFRVNDNYADKRTKCPTCTTLLTVPAAPIPEPVAVSDEDAAFQALNEGPDPEPTRRSWQESEPSTAPAAVSRPNFQPTSPPPPPPRKPKKSYSDPYSMPERKWSVDWGRVGGGVMGVLLGGGLLVGGLAAGRFFIWSPIILIGGIIAIINGLMHQD